MYKLLNNPATKEPYNVMFVQGDVAFSAPFSIDNTDYQKFKADVLAGAELQDADGVVMSQAEAQAFVETLP